MDWQTSCLDWERRLIAGASIIPAPIFPDQAAQALAAQGGDDLLMGEFGNADDAELNW